MFCRDLFKGHFVLIISQQPAHFMRETNLLSPQLRISEALECFGVKDRVQRAGLTYVPRLQFSLVVSSLSFLPSFSFFQRRSFRTFSFSRTSFFLSYIGVTTSTKRQFVAKLTNGRRRYIYVSVCFLFLFISFIFNLRLSA